jgi:hypothetical protein
MIVYSVTLIDLMSDQVLGNRRTPVIFTTLERAIKAVKNNEKDLADNNLYQYAVIEETKLNVIRPDLETNTKKYWFKYNTVLDEFEPFTNTQNLTIFNLSGFGIG